VRMFTGSRRGRAFRSHAFPAQRIDDCHVRSSASSVAQGTVPAIPAVPDELAVPRSRTDTIDTARTLKYNCTQRHGLSVGMGTLPAHLFGAQDAAEALRLLAAGAGVAGDLDQHVGLRDINGVVAHLGQEHRVDLQPTQVGTIQAFAPSGATYIRNPRACKPAN